MPPASRAPTAYERHAPAPAAVEAALAPSRHAVFWLEDAPGTTYAALTGATRAPTSRSSAAATAGCGPRCSRSAATPAPGWCCSRRTPIGWAASGRNGGFCEASLTHGEENGRTRWPDEYDALERLGADEPRRLRGRRARPRPGLPVRAHRPAGRRRRAAPGRVAARVAGLPRPRRRARARSTARSSWPASGAATTARWCTRRGWPASWPGSRPTLGVEIHEGTRVTGLDAPTRGPVVVRTTGGSVTADRVALATNVFPSLLRRTRMLTVPVYDYVLMTEPLTDAQLASIGWAQPAGPRRPGQPVPLLPADRRQPDPLGRVRRDLPDRRPGAGVVRGAAGDVHRARLALPRGVPAAGGADLQPPLGRRDRHLHAVRRLPRARRRAAGWRTPPASPGSASARPGSPPR